MSNLIKICRRASEELGSLFEILIHQSKFIHRFRRGDCSIADCVKYEGLLRLAAVLYLL